LEVGALSSERLGRPARIPEVGVAGAPDGVNEFGKALRIRVGELVDRP
jgi:hypothetical protein